MDPFDINAVRRKARRGAAKLTHDDTRRALAGLRERNLPVCTRKPCECEETGERPDLCRMTTRQ